jgi:D-amino-acid dehydrogenase
MRVLVLGAGVVGITTAYYLWRDGHDVTVIDRQSGPALETSYGNAGGLCPSFAGPWAAPGMLNKVLKQLIEPDPPIRFKPKFELRQWLWLARWVANCNSTSFRRNKLCMQRVAHYSHACLKELLAQTQIDNFDFHSDGTLQVFRTEAEVEGGYLAASALTELGIPWRMLKPNDVDALEPSLAQRSAKVVGALYLPNDASGDSHKFSVQLANYLEIRGVQFLFNTQIQAITLQAGAIRGVQTKSQRLSADAYVVALGSDAPFLLHPLGIRLPIYPLKGYSITVPLQAEGASIRTALMDEHNKVMISRLGERVRVAGMAELAGYDLRLDPAQRDRLIRVVSEFLPNGLNFDRVELWAGLRPMTPDGPPILGCTRWPNLFLNSGHGSNGWTQSCGTSRIVADLVGGKIPEIDINGLSAKRFGNSH